MVFIYALLIALGMTLPNQLLTPGVTTALTQDQVCATKWGKDARMVTEAMKRQVAEAYGLKRTDVVGYGRGACCEFDHLISRELGGADDVKNLWPQPWVEAKQKDHLENWLHTEVCAGRMTLAAAQTSISTDWVAAFKKAGL